MPRPKPAASRGRRGEWELHRRELTRLFVAERFSVVEIANFMKKERGFEKAPKDYQYWLKKRNLRRNLHGPELMFIWNKLSSRQQDGRASEVVVSGIRWPESMLRGRLERHMSSCLPSTQHQVHSLPDFLARVQTPSPLMLGLLEWPEELPWLQFNRPIHRAPANFASSTSAGRMCRPHGQEGLLIQMMRHYDTKHYPHLPDESINPRQRMQAMLETIAPQAHAGDHENTVEILHTGSYDSIAVELVRLVIYLESNDLIYRFNELIGCHINLSFPEDMMDFLRGLGFLTKGNIDWLGGCTDPTSQKFLNRLLSDSMCDKNSLDVFRWLIPDHFDVNYSLQLSGTPGLYFRLHTKSWYNGNVQRYRRNYTLLQFSCLAGNINAVRVILDLGADPYRASSLPESAPLECAASLACRDSANAITGLLLAKPTETSSDIRKAALESALKLAIAGSHAEVIVRLLAEREHLGHGTIYSQHFTIAAKHGDCATVRLLVENARRHADGLVQLPGDVLFSVISGAGQDECQTPDLNQLLEKFNYLLNLGVNPGAPRCRYDCPGSFCLEFLIVSKFFRYSDNAIGEDCVLKMIEAMRKHGCPQERPKPTSGGEQRPSTLQLAIKMGYAQVVEYLLDWGADINFVKDESKSEMPTSEDCQCDTHPILYDASGCSPLLTALEYGRDEIAKILLRRKPNLKLHGGELLLAMQTCDDPELEAKLVLAGSATGDEWEVFFEQAVLMRNSKLIELLSLMDTNGRVQIDPSTTMRAALITGDYDKAYQQAVVCGYDSKALFEAVLQSHGDKAFHIIVERLLQMREDTSNDGFEIRAVASAAIHHDMKLLGCLMESFGQGPWIAEFPVRDYLSIWRGEDITSLSDWVPDSNEPPKHILSYAFDFTTAYKDETVLKSLLQLDVPAKGSCLDDPRYMSAQTLNQLIATGLDPNQGRLFFVAVENNLLEHVQALCEAKVHLDAMRSFADEPHYRSRTAIQLAVEYGSPEMLQMLLRYRADVDHPAGPFYGATCLQLAAGAGNIGLVRLLLDRKAKVNARRSLFGGRTAVEIAAENGRLDVLKLLLLQEQHPFQKAAERYQFIRAAKLAEQNGHRVVAKMLRQHVRWNSNDQRLFDEIPGCDDPICHLDDMTQKVSDSDKCDDSFWSTMEFTCSQKWIYDFHEIDGIEHWIGGDYHGPSSQGDFNFEREASVHPSDLLATATGRATEYDEPASDLDHPAELSRIYDYIDVLKANPQVSHVQNVSEQPGGHSQAFSPNMGQEERALAPQAIRCDNEVPAWLNMKDNMADGTTQGDTPDLADTVVSWGVAEHRPGTINRHRRPGMVIGEVQGPHINEGDGAFGPMSMEENYGEVDDSQYFDWGFWDSEGIGREIPSLDLGY